MKTVLLMPVRNAESTLQNTLESITTLNPRPEICAFATNGNTDKTLEILEKWQFPKQITQFEPSDQRFRHSTDIVGQARQKLLTAARDSDAEFALWIDSDIVIRTPQLIHILASANMDIIGGLYYRTTLYGQTLPAYLPFHPDVLTYPIERCQAVGAGCMLASRRVINDQRLNFHPNNSLNMPEDINYCFDARRLGYTVGVVKNVSLNHEKVGTRPWG